MARRLWANGPNGKTPVNAERLNGMEDDIEEALSGTITPDPDDPGFFLIGATNGV